MSNDAKTWGTFFRDVAPVVVGGLISTFAAVMVARSQQTVQLELARQTMREQTHLRRAATAKAYMRTCVDFAMDMHRTAREEAREAARAERSRPDLERALEVTGTAMERFRTLHLNYNLALADVAIDFPETDTKLPETSPFEMTESSHGFVGPVRSNQERDELEIYQEEQSAARQDVLCAGLFNDLATILRNSELLERLEQR